MYKKGYIHSFILIFLILVLPFTAYAEVAASTIVVNGEVKAGTDTEKPEGSFETEGVVIALAVKGNDDTDNSVPTEGAWPDSATNWGSISAANGAFTTLTDNVDLTGSDDGYDDFYIVVGVSANPVSQKRVTVSFACDNGWTTKADTQTKVRDITIKTASLKNSTTAEEVTASAADKTITITAPHKNNGDMKKIGYAFIDWNQDTNWDADRYQATITITIEGDGGAGA